MKKRTGVCRRSCKRYRCHRGSVVDVLAVGICVLAMTVIMMAYLGSIQLLDTKAQVSQAARKYILRMETVGYLTENDKLKLSEELTKLGATGLDFAGSTMSRVDYGSPILLVIRGKITGQSISAGGLFHTVFRTAEYEFEEKRMSTAKN